MTAVPDYDVAVIGAGINGAGIARDAALRGCRVIVIDKNDMCSGTSAVSSRLIHGGLRYLEYGEIPLVYESLHERRILRKIASHLVKPLRITIPVFRRAKRGPLLIRLGMIAYDMLSLGKALPHHEMLNLDEIRSQEPGLTSAGLRGAARYSDAQVTFAERLVLENLIAARAAGANVETYSEVTGIQVQDGAVHSITYIDSEESPQTVTVGAVVNAAGPWVDRVLSTATRDVEKLVGGTKGSHIVVGRFSGAPSDAFYVEAESDGRPIFIIPWNGQFLIGTTDIRYNDDLDYIRASEVEVDYLLRETNRVFPAAALDHSDIHYAYAGVRPLPHQEKGPESAITRRHIIKANNAVASGLLSIIGGKLTTYRNLAEQTVDKLSRVLGRKLSECRTHDTELPGTWGQEVAREQLATISALSNDGIDRLIDVYGGRATAIAELAAEDPSLGELIAGDAEILKAEIVFTVRDEFPKTLADIVFRRTMIGLRADQGRPLYNAIGDVVAAQLGWSNELLTSQLAGLSGYAESLRLH